MWKAILGLLQALPALMGLIERLIAAYHERQQAKKQKSADEAHKKMQEAQTPEEVQDANEDVTRNLP